MDMLLNNTTQRLQYSPSEWLCCKCQMSLVLSNLYAEKPASSTKRTDRMRETAFAELI